MHNCVKVSVVVPVYNAEKYIIKCLDSLLNQTLKEIEIVCVDDGSTDNSLEILNNIAKSNSNLTVLSQQNLKQGAARNKGMSVAAGEYIGFVDADDWVDLEYFEKLYDSAKAHGADIALATNVRVGHGKTKKRLCITEEKEYSSLQEKFDVNIQWKNPCPTNKIYKTSLLKDNSIFWPEGVYCEDKLFTIKAVYYANKIVTVPNVNYYYFRNPSSTVNSKNKVHLAKVNKDKIDAKRAVLDFLKEKKADVRDKDFWALKFEHSIFGIKLYKVVESLKTEKHYMFSVLKIAERKVVE